VEILNGLCVRQGFEPPAAWAGPATDTLVLLDGERVVGGATINFAFLLDLVVDPLVNHPAMIAELGRTRAEGHMAERGAAEYLFTINAGNVSHAWMKRLEREGERDDRLVLFRRSL
jgi:hypothetical protein